MADLSSGEGDDFGVGRMDGEHRVQLGLLVSLRDALARGAGAAEADEILERLVDFTRVHFVSEELLMRLYQYPDYQAHVAEHEDMVERLDEVRASRGSGGSAMTLQTLDALKDVLVGHIARSDRTLDRYLERLPEAAARPHA